MRRILRTVFALVLAGLLLLAGACKTVSTTTLNSESKIFYGGSQIETTVRELTVDGGKTSARIHFINLGTETLGSLQALVEFVDANGDTIATDTIDETFSDEIAVGDGFSLTASCKSDDKIVGVVVSEVTP